MDQPVNPFVKATRTRAKARVAFDGPSGSGKTYTALIWATVLAGDAGKIAVIDTEKGSASLYADEFDFDVFNIDPPFHPHRFVRLIGAAQDAGYDVVVVDSLSHAWIGEGGILSMVDDLKAKGKKALDPWREVDPHQTELVNALVRSDIHLVATLRAKTHYEISEGKVEKVGMKPQQKEGMEYEFTVVGSLSHDHTCVINKTRCRLLADAVIRNPGGHPDLTYKAARSFKMWLGDDEAEKVQQEAESRADEREQSQGDPETPQPESVPEDEQNTKADPETPNPDPETAAIRPLDQIKRMVGRGSTYSLAEAIKIWTPILEREKLQAGSLRALEKVPESILADIEEALRSGVVQA